MAHQMRFWPKASLIAFVYADFLLMDFERGMLAEPTNCLFCVSVFVCI